MLILKSRSQIFRQGKGRMVDPWVIIPGIKTVPETRKPQSLLGKYSIGTICEAVGKHAIGRYRGKVGPHNRKDLSQSLEHT